jgi:hypothetical protein
MARRPSSSPKGAPTRSPWTASKSWLALAEHPERYTIVPTGRGPSSVVDLAGIRSNQIGRFLPDGKRFVFQGAAEENPSAFSSSTARQAPRQSRVRRRTLVWRGANPVSPDGKFLFVLEDLGGSKHQQESSRSTTAPRRPSSTTSRATSRSGGRLTGRGFYIFKREGSSRAHRSLRSVGREARSCEGVHAGGSERNLRHEFVTMTPDEKHYAFNYRRRLSELFLVEGLK